MTPKYEARLNLSKNMRAEEFGARVFDAQRNLNAASHKKTNMIILGGRKTL
jgi:hypothetical protein